MASEHGGMARRLAVTLIAPAGALLLARVPLPGLDVSGIERLIAGGSRVAFDLTPLGLLALELNPFISASWWVELAALVVPRWRLWRLGGYPERAHLWAWVKLLALVLALAQAFFVVRWVQRTSDVYPTLLGPLDVFRDDTLMFVAQTLSLVGGVFALYWAGISAFPRARRYRTLWNFFAPFAPVEILVPVGDAHRAETILRPPIRRTKARLFSLSALSAVFRSVLVRRAQPPRQPILTFHA